MEYLKDRDGNKIKEGDFVSLGDKPTEDNLKGEKMTADNSLGHLPNGWFFNNEDDIYEVYFDRRISNWSLKLNVEPDSEYNCKYMNHALSLLHNGDCKIVYEKRSNDET